MKFVHIADMHFDSPFINLADKEYLGDLRRLEQRKIFKKVIEYIKEICKKIKSSQLQKFKVESLVERLIKHKAVNEQKFQIGRAHV